MIFKRLQNLYVQLECFVSVREDIGVYTDARYMDSSEEEEETESAAEASISHDTDDTRDTEVNYTNLLFIYKLN